MRNSVFAGIVLSLLAVAISPLVHAQYEGQFLPPTPEELKMTADPKAPGAAAVYLNVEETTNDELHYESVYARIKVLQEKGKELATVEVPFLKKGWSVTGIKARTIHADGTIVPLEGKPDDLLIVKHNEFQVDKKVFNLPSVEVGSILEYRYDVRYPEEALSSPSWEIQRQYFVHKAHYSFTPFQSFRPARAGHASMGYVTNSKGHTLNELDWSLILPKGVDVKTDALGCYSLDVADIPAAPQEDWMPPIRNYLYHLDFYYTYARDSKEFWTSENKDWSKDVEHFAEASGPIRDAVRGLIAPGDNDLDKAKKLYKAVQALDNTDFSRKKSETEMKELKLKEAKHAEDTWAQKSGSKQDIAMLYLAMLRAAGLTAYGMEVVNRDQGIFNPSLMETRQLDDDIVILSTGGKEIYLDPGEKMCPFQFVHWKHSGATGIRQGGTPGVAATSPLLTYVDNATVRIGDVTLDGHGGITGILRFGMTGQRALDLRQEALRSDLDEVEKNFDRDLESLVPDGVEAHVDHFAGLDDSSVQLIAVIKVQGSMGSATAKRLMLPGFFFDSRGKHTFVDQEKRKEMVDMKFPEKVTEQVTYHLPAGLSVEAAPQETMIPWPDHAFLSIQSASASDKITVARVFARGFTALKADEYKDLRDFYQKVAVSDQQQLVLTNAAVAKGN